MWEDSHLGTRHPHFFSTRYLSAIGVFAALQAVVSVVPFSVTLGVSGNITLGVIAAPLIGLLLGPIAGGIAVAIGSLIGLFLNPGGAIFGFLTVLPPSLGAIATGCVRIKRGYLAGAIILLSVAAFYANPFGRDSVLYPWMHILAMILAYSPISKLAASYFISTDLRKIMIAVAVAAFIGTLTDHAFGSGMGIWYFYPALGPAIWNLIMYVYPVERLVTVLIVTVIGAPVYQRLKVTGIIDALR